MIRKRISIVFSLLVAAALVTIGYNNCSTRNVFQSGSYTGVGNPMTTGHAAVAILQTICQKLTSCNSNLSMGACLSGVTSTGGIAEALGLPGGDYANYGDAVAADTTSTIAANLATATSCLSSISTLSCQDPFEMNAYNPTQANPFSGVTQLLALDSATSVCHSVYPSQINLVQSWTPIDNGSVQGLNYLAGSFGQATRMAVSNNKLYVGWTEFGAPNLFISVFNSNYSAPGLTAVDSGSFANYNWGELVDFNGVLISAAVSGNQINVTHYNGNDAAPAWLPMDRVTGQGLNFDVTKSAKHPNFCVANNKLYGLWLELNAAGVSQLRAAVFNGNYAAPSWQFVDGGGLNGLNRNVSHNADIPKCTEFNNKLYFIDDEDNTAAIPQVQFGVYNGNDSAPAFQYLSPAGEAGSNGNATQAALWVNLISYNSNLYFSWLQNPAAIGQARIAVYNANDASPSVAFIDTATGNGINHNPALAADGFGDVVHFQNYNGALYVTWYEDDGSGINQIRVASYTGTPYQWKFVDGNTNLGLNRNTSHDASFKNFKGGFPWLQSFNNRLFIFWSEDDGSGLYRYRGSYGQ